MVTYLYLSCLIKQEFNNQYYCHFVNTSLINNIVNTDGNIAARPNTIKNITENADFLQYQLSRLKIRTLKKKEKKEVLRLLRYS